MLFNVKTNLLSSCKCCNRYLTTIVCYRKMVTLRSTSKKSSPLPRTTATRSCPLPSTPTKMTTRGETVEPKISVYIHFVQIRSVIWGLFQCLLIYFLTRRGVLQIISLIPMSVCGTVVVKRMDRLHSDFFINVSLHWVQPFFFMNFEISVLGISQHVQVA